MSGYCFAIPDLFDLKENQHPADIMPKPSNQTPQEEGRKDVASEATSPSP
jgi:hypothetical protein